MTPPRTSHPWAIVEAGRVRWHVPGSWPPEYAVNDELEALWRKGQPMGVRKKMPSIGRGPNSQIKAENGIHKYRNAERYNVNDALKAPFPWPGGKSDMAGAVWARFGVCDNYVEPLCGSAAMLLGRPGGAHGTETVNDVDGLLINAYRCIQFAPDETAEWCDWPVSEADLTSRHLYLKANRDELTQRLFAEPLYCDPMLGGWWLWGIASWIGDGWCVADGPWINVDGRLVDRRVANIEQEGVGKRIPHVSAGHDKHGNQATSITGIQKYRASGPHPPPRASVPRKMPEVGSGRDRGTTHQGVQAYRHHAGVPRQMPDLGAWGDNSGRGRGTNQKAYRESDSARASYFARLSDRLRRVRFLCGDWRRACKDSVTVNHGLTAVFLDPPYPQAEHDMAYHEAESGDVWYQAAAWAIENGDDPRLRICIAGYWSDATDALFPATWERLRWEARGGYANQKADGRGRANAKRECLWFSKHCIDAKTDYGPLFAGLEDA